MSEFNFRGWAAASKLTPATRRALVENDLAERDALLCVTPDMLKALGLTVGQYALVCKATAQIQAAASAATETAIAVADLKEDQDLAKQLAQVEGKDEFQNPSLEQGCSVVRRYRWHLVVVSTILVTSGVIIAGGVFGAPNQGIQTANPTDGFGKATPLPGTERASTTTCTAAISTTEDTSKNRITFGGEGTEPGKFGAKLEGKPLAVSPSNEMFIADRGNRRIQVFNMTGGFLRHFSTGDWDPLALCIAHSGGVWVLAWPARRHVEPEDDRPHAHKYSKDGRLLTSFNMDPINFIPSAIVADTLSDNIMVMWVQCRGKGKDDNCAVVVFRPDGTLARMFGDIYKPSSLTVDREGNVYVLESWRHSIYKFDKFGRRLSIFQRRPKGTGYLQMPQDICADGLGHLIVTDGQRKKRVQMFTAYGEYIRTVARNTNQAVVASCAEGRFVVVADYTVTIIRDYSSRQNRTYLL
ncbi:tripartite motif-containing protein 2-like [Branchiostoma lanceolatum]|uniref:tripartite motif-containing protein 2-like n=1 Tax=Branchiostoma lanceolatum TaxID=7740 RepID=UPI003451C48A